MRTLTLVLFAVSFSQALFAVANPIETLTNNKRAVINGHGNKPLLETRTFLSRRGTYKEDEAEDLEEKAEGALENSLYAALDVLKALFNSKGIPYAVQGGLAIKLQGKSDRETHDLDISVSTSSKNLQAALKGRNDIQWHEKIAQQLGAGGTKLYLDAEGHKVQADVLLSTGELGQDVSKANDIRGYKILDLPTLFKSKLGAYSRRGEEKDLCDLIWMYESKASAIKSSVGSFNEYQRYEFARAYADYVDDDEAKALYDFLGIEGSDSDSESENESDDESDDD
ncbi:hypothetical protein F5X99DRAFT_425224 [Biscogniauxia marginata]|nr:hypothetical protein F5X99DRAFT_425224 [Biscogniauxia marginata]